MINKQVESLSLHDNASTILNSLKQSGQIVVDCGRGLNRSSTGIGLILSGNVGVFVVIFRRSG